MQERLEAYAKSYQKYYIQNASAVYFHGIFLKTYGRGRQNGGIPDADTQPSLTLNVQVAIKRANVLLSVLVGGLVFKENIMRRVPYVLLMLCGMTCIVLDPKS